MAQSKNIGHGITFHRVTAGPTKITFIRRIQFPEFSREDVNCTDLDDTVQYNVPSDPEDPGEVEIEMFWTSGDTNDELIDTDFNARTIGSWKVVLPSPITRTATFSAWVKATSPEPFVSNGAVVRRVRFRLTTIITWT